MRLELNVRWWHLGLLVLLCVWVIVAAVDKSGAWHAAEQVRVVVDGTVMSLQEAVDQERIHGGVAQSAGVAYRADVADDAGAVGGLTRSLLERKCSHNECVGQQCVSVAGYGIDQCTDHAQCWVSG